MPAVINRKIKTRNNVSIYLFSKVDVTIAANVKMVRIIVIKVPITLLIATIYRYTFQYYLINTLLF